MSMHNINLCMLFKKTLPRSFIREKINNSKKGGLKTNQNRNDSGSKTNRLKRRRVRERISRQESLIREMTGINISIRFKQITLQMKVVTAFRLIQKIRPATIQVMPATSIATAIWIFNLLWIRRHQVLL